MILRRCSLLSTIRCASEFPEKRCSYNRGAGLLLIQRSFVSIKGRQLDRADRSSTSFPSLPARMASTSTDNPKDNDKKTKKNRLALEKSPYLRQHATNPVDWYPWGAEALEKAKKEQKLIFLSVGYSTCHWCHVMEKESFKDEDIAKIMNKYYVNIKVDREERPDIDRIYMAFVQAVSGHGGWPMSVFLTPDLNPISGGTYFPPEDRFNYPGFKTVLLRIAEEWKHLKAEMLESGNSNFQTLQEITNIPQTRAGGVPPVASGELCVVQLAKEFEPDFGGFGGHNMCSPKFPQPVKLNLLFHMYSRDPTSELGKKCLHMCEYTLTKMAYGGIHDHIGKGFARYSTDGQWHVPHFEKMLYDQGQIMQSYAEAFLATNESLFAEIVDDIATYVTRDLRHKDGGFYSAEDADSYPEKDATAKEEGAFYVWSMDELTNLLSKPESDETKVPLLDIFTYHFNVKPQGNVKKYQDPHGELMGKNVLIVSNGVQHTAEKFNITAEEAKKYLEKACSILYTARLARPRPHLDDKIITAWNGLMISGLARGGMALGNKRYIEYAADAAKFVERYLFDAKKRELLHSCYRDEGDVITQPSVPIHGFLDDYAFMIKGLLDLYEASLDEHWLELAEQLQVTQDKLFWDPKNSGYFCTATQDPSVILRLKEVYDGAEPSGNSIAAGNLLRLATYFDRGELKDKAGSLFAAFMTPLLQRPAALPQLVSTLIHYHDGMTQIYIAGKRDAKDTDDLLRVVYERLIPGRVLLLADHENPESMIFRKNEFLGKMKPQEGRATAYVCRHRTCSLPVTTAKDLADLLDEKSYK